MIPIRLIAFLVCSLSFLPLAHADYTFCGDRYCPQINAGSLETHSGYQGSQLSAKRRSGHRNKAKGVSYIPNPAGTWRTVASCAHRLAAYWGLGKGLDAVSTWPERFRRAGGPGVGIAAVRRNEHHILGIIGGGPGAWVVADFNSTRGHGNREYTVASFPGYFFVDPRSRKAEN